MLRLLVFATTFALCSVAAAQPWREIPHVDILEPGLVTNVCNEGVRQGLRALGYVEGQNLVIQTRYAEWKSGQLHPLAAQLAQIKPNLIWTHSLGAIRAVRRATTTIPIIVGVSRNLVELGIVSSLAHPGGNITGMDLSDSEILGKRLELMKEALPKISRVAVLVDPRDPGHASIPQNMEEEAGMLRVRLRRVEARSPEAFEETFSAVVQDSAEALILPESPMFSQNRQRIFKVAKQTPPDSGRRTSFCRGR
jgi:putative ABC transport system substrate-binding protein